MQTGTIYVQLDLDTSGFDKGLAQAGQAAEKGGGFLSNALSFATGGAILGGLSAVKDSIFGVASAMIDGNAEFETYQTQFGVLLGSTEEAKTRLAELAKFGSTTPFELPELVRADKVLTSFGIHSEEMLTIVGDVAAGTGASFEDMALLMGKFSAGSTGEVISRFQELGIATKDELAKMGIEFDKGGAMITPVAEAMPILEQIMKDKFGGMMEAQSQTFSGMVSNLQDWVGGTLRTLGQPIFEVVKDKLGVLLAFLSSPEVVAALDVFANGLATVIGGAIDFISNVAIPAFITAFNLISPLFASVGTEVSAFGEIWQALQPVISAVTNYVQTVITVVFSAIQAFLKANGADIQAFLSTTWTAIKDIIITLVKIINITIVPIFNIIAGFIKEHGDVITGLLTNAWTVIKSIITIAIALIKGILNTTLALIKGDWSGAWESIKTMVNTIWEAIKSIIGAAISNIKLVLSLAWDAIKSVAQAAWEAVKQSIVTEINNAKAGLDLTINNIKTALSNAWEAVKSTATTAWNAMKAIINDPIGSAKRGLDLIIEGIKGMLFSAWESVRETASSKWGTISSTIETAFDIKSKIDGVISDVKSALSGAWESIQGTAKGAWEGIANSISSAFDGVTDKIKSIVNQAIRYVNRLISAYNEVASTLGLDGLDRISELASGTNNFAGGLALVGERGPELVALPRGTQVTPAGKTREILNNSRTVTFNQYVTQLVSPTQELAMVEAFSNSIT